MKNFEKYLDKMGYSWNDFHRTYEMRNLIEQYADERVKQALSIANVVNQRELLLAFCEFMHSGTYDSHNTTHSQDVDAFLESQ